MESLNIFIRSIFIDNMVFAFFFGMCSYIAVSKSVKTALGLGAAVTFVMVMTVPLNYLLYEFVLKAGALSWAGLPDVNLDFLTLSSLSPPSPLSCSWWRWPSRSSRRRFTASWASSCR